MESHYSILGVSRSATRDEIQAAYRRRARELHPDVNTDPEAETRFKELVEAYQVLRDDTQRARYDDGQRRVDRSRRRGRRGIRFEDIRVGTDDLRSSIDDILEQAKRRRGSSSTGQIRVRIDLAEAYSGTVVEVPRAGRDGATLSLTIPPGAKSGDRLTLRERQVTVILDVETPVGITLDGRNVTMTVDVMPWEAALGRTVEFAAPHRTLRVKIPEGSSSGRTLRIRGQGLPQKPGRAGAPGDLFVRLSVALPEELSTEERELYERLEALRSRNPQTG